MAPERTFAHYVFVDFENVPCVDLAAIAGKPVHVTLLIGKQQKRLDVSLVRQALQHPDQVHLIEVGVSGRNALDLVLAAYLGRASLEHPDAEFTVVSKDRDFDPLLSHLHTNQVRVSRDPDFFTRPHRERPRRPVTTAGATPAAVQRVSRRERAEPLSPLRTNRPMTAVSDGSYILPTGSASDEPPIATAPRLPRTKSHGLPVAEQKLGKIVARFSTGTGPLPRNRARLLHHLSADFGNKLPDTQVGAVLDELVRRGLVNIDANQRVTYPKREAGAGRR